MIPPHLFYQIYLSFLKQNDSTPPKCGELSEYTDSAHTGGGSFLKIYEWVKCVNASLPRHIQNIYLERRRPIMWLKATNIL